MDKINIIRISVPWELLISELEEIAPKDVKMYIAPMIKILQQFEEKKLELTKKWLENSLIRIEACLDRIWETLNSGNWKDVSIKYRRCYSLCSILKAALLEIQCEYDELLYSDVSFSIIEQMDRGILLGAPISNLPDLFTHIASKVHKLIFYETDVDSIVNNDITLNESLLSNCKWVDRYNNPSMESFYNKMFSPKVPGILEGCITHWRAIALWKDVNYLIRVAGARLVPIEIGSRYTEEDWSQKMIRFSEFLKTYITIKNSQIGYLAQHQLFEQIPEFKSDFSVPDYCNFSDTGELDVNPETNVWFGPAETVSPLHFDIKNNLLCQVVGYKRVILFHPDSSEHLYPYKTKLLNNTAAVDPINPDFEKWPEFRKCTGLMCYLKPGDMLYIPPKWWHHVTSLTVSFSISFWWQ